MSTAATREVDEVLEGFLGILLEFGPLEVPEKYRSTVEDEAWARICDPDTGFMFFWLNFASIQIKGKGWQRACPGGKPRQSENGNDWAWQVEIARILPLHELLLVLKARQIGFTFLVASLLVWAAISADEQAISVVANKLGSSKRLIRRAIQCYNRLPEWIRQRVALTNPAVSRLEFSNGSFAEPFAGGADSARGDASDWLFVDEIGEIDNLDDWFAANSDIADGGGRMVMFGTAKNNGLESWVKDCVAGDEIDELVIPRSDGSVYKLPVVYGVNEMAFVFVPDYVHPDRDDAWREKKLRLFKGNRRNFAREHPMTVEDAFVAQGNGYFDAPALAIAFETARCSWEERDRRGTLLPNGMGGYRFVEDSMDGHVVIHATPSEFERIIAENRPWAIGADCAGDRATGDYHAASALQVGVLPTPNDDLDTFEVIPHRQLITIHGHMDSDHYAELLVRLGHFLGGAVLAIEQNGVGTAVLKYARRAKYPYLYMRRVKDSKIQGGFTDEYGWWTDNARKNQAYGELERCLRNGWTEIRDVDTLIEMGNVLRLGGSKLGARDPKHDDRPDGLAIAHAVADTARLRNGMRSTVRTEPEWGSLEWLNRRIDARLAAENNTAIGSENRHILAR